MKKTRFFLVFLCVLITFPPICSAVPLSSLLLSGRPEAPAGGKQTVPFELVGHLIVLKASIDGSGPVYTFVLDTGSITAVTKDLASRLGLGSQGTCRAMGATGEGDQVCLTRLKSLALGGFAGKDIPAVVFDPHFRQRAGIDIDGFIGSNFLRFFRVEIDYRNKLLTLSRDTAPLAPVAGGAIVNIGQDWKNAFVPQVALKCGDSGFTAWIDTGLYDTMSIPGPFLGKTNMDAQIESVGAMGSGNFGNMEKTRMVRLSGLSIGPLKVARVIATSQPGQKYALIGYGLLSNFTVTIDYPAKKMLLAPAEGGRPMDNLFSTGIAISRDYTGKTFVAGVWKPSPAGTLGLEPGEEITRVDGRPAAGYTLARLETLLFDDAIPRVELSIKETFGDKDLTIGKKYLF